MDLAWFHPREPSVQVLGGEAAFAGVANFHSPVRLRRQRRKNCRRNSRNRHAIVHGWGGDYSRGGLELPLLRPGLQVHRVEIAIGAANVGVPFATAGDEIM